MSKKSEALSRLKYRVLVEGDHVGAGGCGRAHWFESSPEAHEFAAQNQCDIANGKYGDPGNCWGTCEVTVTVGVHMEGYAEYLVLSSSTTGEPVLPEGALF